jgi:hypothetical protein
MMDDLSVAHTENAQTQPPQEQPAEQPQVEQQTEPKANDDRSLDTTETEASAEPGETTAETVDTEGEKKRNNVPARERIKQLTDQRKAAEARAAELERQLQAVSTDKAKDPLDYANDAEYQRAIVREAVAEARADIIRQQAEAANAEKQALRVATWEEKTSAIREKAADFDAVVYGQHVSITPVMADVIMDSDHGADVAYFLGKNPAEAQRIARLSPLAAAMEIGRLSQRFAEPPAVKRTTSAPRPPTTLQGHGSPSEPDPSRMTNEQFRAWRAKQ